MVKLKTHVAPLAAAESQSAIPAQTITAKGNTARFIRRGDSRPSKGTQPTNFRLPVGIIEMLDEEALATGQNKTTILKAALLAYCTSMDQNEKNRWLLEAPKH